MVLVNMFLITLIVCFIIDYSGVIEEIEKGVNKVFKTKIFHLNKPFSCSLCMSFWLNVAYTLLSGTFWLYGIALACVFALFSSSITRFIFLIKGLVEKIMEIIEKKLEL